MSKRQTPHYKIQTILETEMAFHEKSFDADGDSARRAFIRWAFRPVLSLTIKLIFQSPNGLALARLARADLIDQFNAALLTELNKSIED